MPTAHYVSLWTWNKSFISLEWAKLYLKHVTWTPLPQRVSSSRIPNLRSRWEKFWTRRRFRFYSQRGATFAPRTATVINTFVAFKVHINKTIFSNISYFYKHDLVFHSINLWMRWWRTNYRLIKVMLCPTYEKIIYYIRIPTICSVVF